MIIDFSIKNFGPVKEEQTLSFEADKSTHLEDHYIIDAGNGLRLLKMALIYGANASGKTTILKALEFLRKLVLDPEKKKTDELEYNPFLFDPETPKQNSVLSINFIQNQIKYFYEVEFTKKAIVKEELYFYNPNKAKVFTRTTDEVNQFSKIDFGGKIKIDTTSEKVLEGNTLWNNTVLGGFLKTNIEVKELKEVTTWFREYPKPLITTRTSLKQFINNQIKNSFISKNDVVNILQKADFNISNVIIEERDITEKLLELLEKDDRFTKEKLIELKSKGLIKSDELIIEHSIKSDKYQLPFELESEGTKRYYEFSGILAMLIKDSMAFPIDELESSLHPELFQHFIISFLINAKNSQIIATTHNREILDNRDLFRDDAIWIADKDENAATILYSLADFDSSITRNNKNILNAYKSGKLGGTPNLGDYYIELNP
ncbi:ATP/GTP-binding protein [Emticicia sp. 21SJ11W-3]|uniref:AAA family ATPase n=1 Tax=Emticicia sp. 21SJ11W-3 TaxID=2916755 RepID=UPI00209D51EC|nr:ATP-binding protein [Emticicia sp. 21SJ11W-3]UTA66705.1 ATP-binding protein [Emticicia sp. 21SJ11W-3]